MPLARVAFHSVIFCTHAARNARAGALPHASPFRTLLAILSRRADVRACAGRVGKFSTAGAGDVNPKQLACHSAKRHARVRDTSAIHA